MVEIGRKSRRIESFSAFEFLDSQRLLDCDIGQAVGPLSLGEVRQVVPLEAWPTEFRVLLRDARS